ncbi:hypothetical protein ANCCAN_00533 [Ancylostoma caninum]|uniref:Uncharacterized protein n=1 Tax=Ancylostoma caninum TaxID=29170 RepID=A0A368HDP5_ANCCA|nr:hypothetical protein ANCCAN_00533 [Ancylostoma caninum]
MRHSSLEVLLCGLSLFDVLVLSSTLLIYPAMNACQNEPDPVSLELFERKSAVCSLCPKICL